LEHLVKRNFVGQEIEYQLVCQQIPMHSHAQSKEVKKLQFLLVSLSARRRRKVLSDIFFIMQRYFIIHGVPQHMPFFTLSTLSLHCRYCTVRNASLSLSFA
jgi:hypothetical protein